MDKSLFISDHEEMMLELATKNNPQVRLGPYFTQT